MPNIPTSPIYRIVTQMALDMQTLRMLEERPQKNRVKKITDRISNDGDYDNIFPLPLVEDWDQMTLLLAWDYGDVNFPQIVITPTFLELGSGKWITADTMAEAVEAAVAMPRALMLSTRYNFPNMGIRVQVNGAAPGGWFSLTGFFH
jgi:hypothetical protein